MLKPWEYFFFSYFLLLLLNYKINGFEINFCRLFVVVIVVFYFILVIKSVLFSNFYNFHIYNWSFCNRKTIKLAVFLCYVIILMIYEFYNIINMQEMIWPFLFWRGILVIFRYLPAFNSIFSSQTTNIDRYIDRERKINIFVRTPFFRRFFYNIILYGKFNFFLFVFDLNSWENRINL